MMISHKHVIRIGRGVRHLSRLRGGTGSALPGLVVEKLSPQFVVDTLQNLSHGVVIVTGTNGKTTTTKMLVKLLSDNGLRVFTNRTGSNFTRGIIASLLAEVSPRDGVLQADVAVLELDEAYAARFVKLIRPRYCVLLNVMRDQLDRFGEIDHTASLLGAVADATTDGIVINRDDPLLYKLASDRPTTVDVRFFGIATSLKKLFPSDFALYGTSDHSELPPPSDSDVILQSIASQRAVFALGTQKMPSTSLKITGVYNMQNAAAALCAARMILGDTATSKQLLSSLSSAKPAFGRGEAIEINGQPLEIILVKNPSGFRLAISSYASRPAKTMIAINDQYADGRDMSWLWDVDFSQFKKIDVVSGTRAYDMALRLQYDEVEVGKVDLSLPSALQALLSGKDQPRRIFCTYTAMMTLRRLLAKKFHLEDIDA